MPSYFFSLEFADYSVDEPHEYEFADLSAARAFAVAALGHAFETFEAEGAERPNAVAIFDNEGILQERVTECRGTS